MFNHGQRPNRIIFVGRRVQRFNAGFCQLNPWPAQSIPQALCSAEVAGVRIQHPHSRPRLAPHDVEAEEEWRAYVQAAAGSEAVAQQRPAREIEFKVARAADRTRQQWRPRGIPRDQQPPSDVPAEMVVFLPRQVQATGLHK